jgi:5'(3')-deoxyribonucleotidase
MSLLKNSPWDPTHSTKPVLLVDMDAILADLTAEWYSCYNQSNLQEPHEDVTVHNVTEWEIPNAKNRDLLWSILSHKGLYRNLPVIPGAIEGMRAIHDSGKFETYIVTAATAAEHTIMEKVQWLGEHFPFIKRRNIIACYNKSLIRGDFLLDDAPHNLEGWLKVNPGGVGLTIDYPYNRAIAVPDKNWLVRFYGYNTPELAWHEIVQYLLHVA